MRLAAEPVVAFNRLDDELVFARLRLANVGARCELDAAFQEIQQQYLKWRNSWNYYQDEALPLAQQQRDGAILAYREGAIDYVTFLQNIRDAIRIEIDSWNAFGNYLDYRYQLEYYLKNSN